MPASKSTKKTPKKAVGGGLSVSDKEISRMAKSAEADMKKHGFKTVDELVAYYDSKRGY